MAVGAYAVHDAEAAQAAVRGKLLVRVRVCVCGIGVCVCARASASVFVGVRTCI